MISERTLQQFFMRGYVAMQDRDMIDLYAAQEGQRIKRDHGDDARRAYYAGLKAGRRDFALTSKFSRAIDATHHNPYQAARNPYWTQFAVQYRYSRGYLTLTGGEEYALQDDAPAEFCGCCGDDREPLRKFSDPPFGWTCRDCLENWIEEMMKQNWQTRPVTIVEECRDQGATVWSVADYEVRHIDQVWPEEVTA